MASVSEGLTRLHELLCSLKVIRDQLARGPRQLKLKEQNVQAVRNDLAQQEEQLKQTRATADKKNLELRSKETHLGDLQIKLNQATSNREYDILKGQIAADQAAKSVLEDEILECLERTDQAQREIAKTRRRIAEAEQDVQTFAAEYEAKALHLAREESALLEQIAEAEKIIPGKFGDTYRRLVAAHGADALSEASGGVCRMCFVSLTPQSQVALNSGEFVFCNCGRLLFVRSDG